MPNTGNQQVVWKYQTPLKSSLLRTHIAGGIRPGLVNPGNITFSGFTLTIASGLAVFVPVRGLANQLVKMTTTVAADLYCSTNTIAIGVSYTEEELSDHYCDIVPLTSSEAEEFDGVIVCMLSCDQTGILNVYPEQADFTTEYYYRNGFTDYMVEHTLPRDSGYGVNTYKLTKLGIPVNSFAIDLSDSTAFKDALVTVNDFNYDALGPASAGYVCMVKDGDNYRVSLVTSLSGLQLYRVFAKLTRSEGVITVTNYRDIPNNLPSQKGYATLDENGRIPYSQLPESAMTYEGNWDASTNEPHLEDGVGTKGSFYICNAAGTVDFGSGDIVFIENDRVIYDGQIWSKLKAGVVQTVNSVEPINGDVTLWAADIPSYSCPDLHLPTPAYTYETVTAGLKRVSLHIHCMEVIIRNTQIPYTHIHLCVLSPSMQPLTSIPEGVWPCSASGIYYESGSTSTEPKYYQADLFKCSSTGKGTFIGRNTSVASQLAYTAASIFFPRTIEVAAIVSDEVTSLTTP